jgi:hypothetical protein
MQRRQDEGDRQMQEEQQAERSIDADAGTIEERAASGGVCREGSCGPAKRGRRRKATSDEPEAAAYGIDRSARALESP